MREMRSVCHIGKTGHVTYTHIQVLITDLMVNIYTRAWLDVMMLTTLAFIILPPGCKDIERRHSVGGCNNDKRCGHGEQI